MKTRLSVTPDAAETLAIQALNYIAEDTERLGRFLALTGIGPADIRTAAHEPRFLAGVLDHIAGNEALLIKFAVECGVPPGVVKAARDVLAGHDWEREVP
ncbi:MAG: DUF3572 domain-containing protein [Pseudolabrys sp.]|nr:DUF3572 domain-containing protein [Pseudolabrys sp.]